MLHGIKVVILILPFLAAAYSLLLSATVFRRIGLWMGCDFDDELTLLKKLLHRSPR